MVRDKESGESLDCRLNHWRNSSNHNVLEVSHFNLNIWGMKSINSTYFMNFIVKAWNLSSISYLLLIPAINQHWNLFNLTKSANQREYSKNMFTISLLPRSSNLKSYYWKKAPTHHRENRKLCPTSMPARALSTPWVENRNLPNESSRDLKNVFIVGSHDSRPSRNGQADRGRARKGNNL
jgi:hypothetical protein